MSPVDVMHVYCPACAAQYAVDDEKLRGKTARMRCKACQTAWSVTGPRLSEAPVVGAPSPQRAAVVRTGKERERRDLFAPEAGPAAVKPALLPLPSGFGARNESSVLFSLDQLKASARAAAPAPKEPYVSAPSGAPSIATDDDGIIDLKALSSAPPRPPAAPLFSEPEPMSLDVVTGAHPARKGFGRAQLMGGIAAAAAVFLLATGGIALALRGEEPVKRTAAVSAPLPVVAPAKIEPAPALAAPAPVSVADEAAATRSKPAKKATKGHHASSKGSAATRSTGASAPARRPVKAADPCHCAGNFNCILACTAKGGK
jgi:predicted Zn finger-like uncharacterized protein